MAITVRCLEAISSLTGEEEPEHIEGVEVFKYIGRMLDRSEDDWTEVLLNTRKARKVCVNLVPRSEERRVRG